MLFPYNRLLAYLLCVTCAVSACSPKKKEVAHERKNTLKHARNLTIEESAEGNRITIHQSFPGGPARSYRLTDRGNYSNIEEEVIIKTPVNSIVGTSTSHIGFIDILDAEMALRGFTTTDFISSPDIRSLIDQNQVIDLGQDNEINMEKLLELSPDLVIAYSVTGNISQYQQMMEFGIPVLYDASYLEPTPLAQAEWIKLIGTILGKEAVADSIFNAIESRFFELKSLIINNGQPRPKVIGGSVYNGTWFMPGGASWVANYIEQAGGDYMWANIPQTGSIPLSFEAVYEISVDADLWIGATAYKSYNQLIKEDERYLKFKAVKDTAIYSPTRRVTPTGGNDYYESGVARPDLVLRDFIKIMNPGIMEGEELVYYKKLE